MISSASSCPSTSSVGTQRARAERNHGDRRAQVFSQVAALDHRLLARRTDPKGSYRLLDVLYIALAQILDVGIERRRQLVADIGRDDDLVRSCERRQTSRQIDAMPVDVVLVDYKRADMDSYAEVQPAFGRDIGIRSCGSFLHFEGHANCSGHARKFEHQTRRRDS